MLLLAIFLIWTFTQNIIRPINEISSTMMELADGNLDIDLPAADQQTELGMMAHALHAFKSGELKRRDAEQEIRRMAMTDPLTGLANRNQFNLRHKEMEAIAKREGKILALLAFDLDRFKPINDSLGHAAGDTVLKHVAQSLLLTFRETDLVARLGGDEFAALLYGPEDLESITHAAKRVIDLLSNPITIDGKDVSVGVSIGISLFQPAKEHKSLETLIRNADRALYEAKESGRNTYRVYEADQNREKVSLLHPTKPE
jgi:diguanylate cyclase (GGDEF)-like protein